MGIYFGTLAAPAHVYTLAEYNGKLGIFVEDSAVPINILDTDISSLPERDKEKIKNGITVFSAEELHSLIEDFSG